MIQRILTILKYLFSLYVISQASSCKFLGWNYTTHVNDIESKRDNEAMSNAVILPIDTGSALLQDCGGRIRELGRRPLKGVVVTAFGFGERTGRSLSYRLPRRIRDQPLTV